MSQTPDQKNTIINALETIRSINMRNVKTAYESGYRSIIIDTPTGTGKTYSIAYYIEQLLNSKSPKAESIQRVFVVTMQKTQRDELGNVLKKQLGEENVYVLPSNPDRLQIAWQTEGFREALMVMGVYMPKLDQVDSYLELYDRGALLPGERDRRAEYLSQCVFGIWQRLTEVYEYNGDARTFYIRPRRRRKKGEEKQELPEDLLALLRALFPLELDKEHIIKVVVMTAKKMLAGVSRNSKDNVFFGKNPHNACIIDESDAFFDEILKTLVDRTADHHTSIPELMEDLYLKMPRLFVAPQSWNVDHYEFEEKVARPARTLQNDLKSFFNYFSLFFTDVDEEQQQDRPYIKNMLYDWTDRNSREGETDIGQNLRIAQWNGRVTSIGRTYVIGGPGAAPGTSTIIPRKEHRDLPSLTEYLIKTRQLINQAAKILREFAKLSPHFQNNTENAPDDNMRKSACAHIGLNENQTLYMCGIMFPENIAKRPKFEEDKQKAKEEQTEEKKKKMDPFLTGFTHATLDAGPDHETKTKIESYSLQVLPALFVRSMLHNSAFTLFLSATGRYDGMYNIPMEYLRNDTEKKLLYEITPSDVKLLTDEVRRIKEVLYKDKPPRVFIEHWSVEGFFDNNADDCPEYSEDRQMSMLHAVQVLDGINALNGGVKEYLAYVLQVVLDEYRFRESIGEDTYVFTLFQTKKIAPSEVFRYLCFFAKKEAPDGSGREPGAFYCIARECEFAYVEAGRLYRYTKTIPDELDPSTWRLIPVREDGDRVATELDHIEASIGTKMFVFCAERSGGRGFDHSVVLDGETHNLSGLAIKRFSNIIPGLTRNSSPKEVIYVGAGLVNAGYVAHATDVAWDYLNEHIKDDNEIYKRDPFVYDDRSPYKIEMNAKIAQVCGRFRNDPPLGQTVIRIDEDLLTKDGLLQPSQFVSVSSHRDPIPCMLGYELSLIIAAAEGHKGEDVPETEFEKWNKSTTEMVKEDVMKLGLAKKKRSKRDIPPLFKKLEARKIASRTGGRQNYIDMEEKNYEQAKAWMDDSEHRALYCHSQYAVREREIQKAYKLLYRDSLSPADPKIPFRNRDAGLYEINLYEPLRFYKMFLPTEEITRIEKAFAPVLDATFVEYGEDHRAPTVYSDQCASYFIGECGEAFAKALIRTVLKRHETESSMLSVMSLKELVDSDMIYRYEDADIFLHKRVAVDSKAYTGDILIADHVAKDEGYVSMANKMRRMPDGDNYLLFVDTQFTGDAPRVEEVTRENNATLRALCEETGKELTVYTLNHLFTREELYQFGQGKSVDCLMRVDGLLWNQMLKKVCHKLKGEKNG